MSFRRRKKIKSILAALLVLALFPHAAHADNIKLKCEGPNGIAEFLKTDEGVTFDIVFGETSLNGFVKANEEAPNGDWQNASSSITLKPPSMPNADWLSISASKGKTVWHPPHQGCLSTRIPQPCSPITVPGRYGRVSDSYVHLLLDITDIQNVKILNLDIPGDNSLNPLGEPHSCKLQQTATWSLASSLGTNSSCKVAPQNDCSKSPKRLCCDCSSGQLTCY